MSEPVIFKDLPATFPGKNKYRKPSVIGGVIFQVILIAVLLLIPLLLPEKISHRQLLVALIAPPPPPPAAPPRPPVAPVAPPKVVKPPVRPVAPDVLVIPSVVPKDVARIIEEPPMPAIGIIGAVPAGIPGGVTGGILGNVLSANGSGNGIALPPPPPPPPPPPKIVAGPVRVGGDVKEPRVVKLVPPVYPPIASKARVSGTVVMEAILTEDGTVDQIRVISGHPFLIEAAMSCVKHWKYEPTLLNGIAVRVVLTAKVNFNRPT
ncbi:MAG TPA: energy transducer TonB [Terriglobia bacterium]|nr:energy transducer TonB [Terriglobia bacterium]